MKKLTTFVLTSIGLIGGVLVTEGLITGEELSAIQNVLGMALGGGALSIGLIIAIIQAIPVQLVNAGYQKAVDKYGQVAVDNIFSKFDEFLEISRDNNTLLNEVNTKLDEAKEERENLLSE